ncbi:MAG TPA: AMP-dependent synthetase/ligase [Patescibacteria group bacterium]|nr:AMP-dependent synthetase/ligase [Patescibacteria group bacterium]
MDYQSQTSLTAMFFEQAARLGDKPFLWRKRDKSWQSLSWRDTARQVDLLARGLRAVGIQPGDRVLLIAENRPEWLIADLGIMAAGAVTVPGYTTNTVADTLHLLNNSGARLVIVSSKGLAERAIAAALNADHAAGVIAIEPLGLMQDPGIAFHQWDDVLALGGTAEDDIAQRVATTTRADLACVIYTSGTGGAPKGVMLSHGAIIANCMGAYELLLEMGLTDEVFLSFLPLSHSYEHTAGQFFPISLGAQIYYAESIEALSANMIEARPTIMTAVPRLYETMRARILKGIERTGGYKAKLFMAAVRLGSKRYETPDQMTLAERIYNKLLDRLVRRKVAARFGGRLKALVSGGAPLNYEVGLFFTALGVRILQGYGQTESAPVVSCNPPSKVKLHTVGPPVKGVEVRIAADGEILVRGELVMQGYWGDAAATAQVIQDGWLHTGDIGLLDEDGFIHITDRKKDIIVNSGGDNISPQRVEGFLTLQTEIAQAMVYGDRRPHLVALLVPDADAAAAWAAAREGKPSELAELIGDVDFRRSISEAVDRVNRTLSPIEKVRRFILTAEPFTVDNEMCTPTLKIRRHVIVATYGEMLRELYEERR